MTAKLLSMTMSALTVQMRFTTPSNRMQAS
ncbi:hypothetical protein I3842_12G022900 [Carya illinoinensis]|uniref:Uncharacterized protein n=1 Tax=Carya illinoinensis TaxID=32201 RepID=A0A922DFT8_CARIL|nr:hypothetical protein I3842_12G022900 [Carya illinoinensis]